MIRPFKNEVYQRIAYYKGHRQNIRNNGGKCLDVHGGSNTHRRHMIFWNCHKGLNQAWFLTTAVPKPLPPAPKPKPAPKPVTPPKPIYKPVRPPRPTRPKPVKKPVKPVDPGFGKNPKKPYDDSDKPIRHTFTWKDM